MSALDPDLLLEFRYREWWDSTRERQEQSNLDSEAESQARDQADAWQGHRGRDSPHEESGRPSREVMQSKPTLP